MKDLSRIAQTTTGRKDGPEQIREQRRKERREGGVEGRDVWIEEERKGNIEGMGENIIEEANKGKERKEEKDEDYERKEGMMKRKAKGRFGRNVAWKRRVDGRKKRQKRAMNEGRKEKTGNW